MEKKSETSKDPDEETEQEVKLPAQKMAINLYSILEAQESLDTLQLVGTDSCAFNTGHKAGVHACLERLLERPLQRMLCKKE